jgi:hypothetical protein
VKVEGKAEGGTITPVVTFSLSPDYSYVPAL